MYMGHYFLVKMALSWIVNPTYWKVYYEKLFLEFLVDAYANNVRCRASNTTCASGEH